MNTTHLKFRYVPGTQVPEGGPASPADNQPASWTSRIVAGFDGGYRLGNHVGGYYYVGQTVSPLRSGLMALVISKRGKLSIGAWDRDLHMNPGVAWCGRIFDR